MVEAGGKKRGVRKERTGIVVSRSGNKSVMVRVERRYAHPLYGKTVKDFTKFHVHDEENKASVGDKVVIVETRPLSRTKRWRIKEMLGETGKTPVAGA